MTSDSTLIQENIEEYVNDDNRIVTYRWLSLTLNIHVNVAKQALYTFVHHQRNKGGNEDINVTYFVAGMSQTKSGDPVHKCIVVPENHLESVKSTLNPVTSCHVYSVQKARLKDYTSLYQTDYDIIKENLSNPTSLGSIKCPWAKVRSGKARTARVEEKTESSVKREVKKESPTSKPDDSSSSKASSTSSTSTKGKKAEPKGSIASMFAGAGKKAQASTKDKEKTAEPAVVKTQSKPAGQKKGVVAFFGKQSASTKSTSQAAKTSEEIKVKEEISRKPKNKKPRDDESDDEGTQRKKRRRIKTDLFDSSDEEEEEEPAPEEEIVISDKEETKEEEEDEEETPPPKKETERESEKEVEEEEVKIVTNESGRRRKRTRKLVPKQYVDEEGFMVTEKVWESDSTDADDEELEEERKKKEEEEKRKAAAAVKPTKGKGDGASKPAPKKSTASPQKGKQTSLMSFFKKK